MEAFFKKYPLDGDESMALKMIYTRAKELVKLCDAGEDYESEYAYFKEMVCDFAEAAGIETK